MKRIGNLGLAVLAALALTAVLGAASSPAAVFRASSKAVEVEGQETEQIHIGIAGRGWDCPTSEFIGGASTFMPTIAPEWMSDSECTGSAEKATLKMNGCRFIFHAGSQNAEGAFVGSFDIGPAGCGPIVLKGAICEETFPPQGNIGVLTYSNEGKGSEAHVQIHANAAGIEYTSTKTNCGGKGTFKNASLDGSWGMQALDASGSSAGLEITPVGIYLGAGGFEAEAYPDNMLGKQAAGSTHVLTFNGERRLECTEVGFSASLTEATKALSVQPSFPHCNMWILGTRPVVIKTNSCHYVFGSAGTLGVSCTKEGDGVEFIAYGSQEVLEKNGTPLCTYKIGAQEGLKGLSMSNFGEAGGRGISTEFKLEGIKFSVTQGFASVCKEGGTNATYTGKAQLTGS